MNTVATIMLIDRILAVAATLIEAKMMVDKLKALQAQKGAELTHEEIDAFLDAEAARVAAEVQAKIDAAT